MNIRLGHGLNQKVQRGAGPLGRKPVRECVYVFFCRGRRRRLIELWQDEGRRKLVTS